MKKGVKIGLAGLVLISLVILSAIFIFRQKGGKESPVVPEKQPVVQAAVVDLAKGANLTLVRVAPGSFIMGAAPGEDGVKKAETPGHKVSVSPFWIGATEVTVAQFSLFVSETGYEPGGDGPVRSLAVGGQGLLVEDPGGHTWRNPGFRQGPDHPVVFVTYSDATAFCGWLSKKTGASFGLPTEAQWEGAARAGTSSAWFFGADPQKGLGYMNGPDLSAQKTYSGLTGIFHFSDGFVRTAPVMSFFPNPFGIYDVHGNAAEWCADWFGPAYYAQSPEMDPKGPETGAFRVIRGGSWAGTPQDTRSSARSANFPDMRSNDTGFRVACEKLPPGATVRVDGGGSASSGAP